MRAPRADRADITGRDFAGLRFAAAPQSADLVLSASRASVWTEGVGFGGVACERLLLRGDVRVELGAYRFTAAQAVVWVQRVSPSSKNPQGQVSQVAISFDRVADPGAQAGFSQAADRLLVTGVLEGAVSLRADAVNANKVGELAGEAGAAAFVNESEARLAEHLRALIGAAPASAPTTTAGPGAARGISPGVSRPYEPNSPLARAKLAEPAAAAPRAPGDTPTDVLFSNDGIITFAVGTQRPAGQPTPEGQEEIKLIRGGIDANGVEQDNSLLLSGGVVFQYQDIRKNRDLQISSQRAVVFLKPGPLSDLARFSIKDVRGIYVEGDVVATDGQYTLRGPRVYYDVQNNQALMVDAVFFTFDPKLQQPIYIRAKELRQRAANQFSATSARLAMTSFFDPVLSIGASEITITQRAEASLQGGEGSGRTGTYLHAKDLTLRFADLPFFWLPTFKGDVGEIPLEDFRVESSSGSGAAIKTGWNLFGLLGTDRPEDLRSRFLLDWYFDRGVALGTRTGWDNPKHEGDVFGYILPDDNGEDVLSSGARRGRDGEVRGMILGKDRWTIDPNWTLFLEGNYISDENFVDAFFRNLGTSERELSNSAFLRYVDDNSAFTFQVKGSFNDFTPNQYLLTSQGYTVDKLPEAAYYRVADDLLSQSFPGLLTWTHEYRVSRLAMNFTEPTADELGFDTKARSQAAFGLNPNQTLADQLRAQGYFESDVLRVDTRQELAATFDLDFMRVTPFAVGRFTAYDNSFEDFSADGKQERFFYATGSRFSTQITRVDDSVESDVFDLHRVRHIIEPNVTVWYGGSTLGQNDLPVYDDRVESLATGAAVKAGLLQTWQTQRGGPGRWRSVDWITLNAEIVQSTDDADRESPIGRFFDYRPEYSFLGDFANVDFTWQLTDSVALSSNYVYDLDLNQPARTSAGGTIQHSPDFSTYAEVRYINALDTTYVDGGLGYDLTRRYAITATATYDTDLNELQNVGGTVRRKMRESVLGFSIRYDNIRSETSVSLVIEPNIAAARDRGLRLRELGR